MSPAEIQALVAAAAPGTRVTVVIVEVPGQRPVAAVAASAARNGGPTPAPDSPDTTKPWGPADSADLAPAIAARRTPFTCVELAQLLQVKPETVSNWCRTQVLRGAAKIPGAGWRIPPSSVLAMLAKSATPPADAAHSGDAGIAPSAGGPAVPTVSRVGRPSESDPAQTPTAENDGSAAAVHTDAGVSDTSPDSSKSAAGGNSATVIGGFDLAGLASWRTRREGSAS